MSGGDPQSAAPAAAAPDAVLDFRDLRRADVGRVGGKGANLGELTAAGLSVPPGFVITAAAYAAFCDGGGLRERIAERLAGLDVEDTTGLDRAAAEVRSMIETEPMPEWLEDIICEAYAGLSEDESDPAVAVRSSATAEDTASASFAGMNETMLNVRGSIFLLDAVRRCWASLFGARTIFYREQKGYAQAEMDIAVVVQRQVEAARAGVMFTLDPATGAADRLVIEGAFGLGESVVSGAVSPDRYVVRKDDLEIEKREIHRKEIEVVGAANAGTLTRELTGDRADQPALSDEEARSIAELGTRIENHYGSPQDTEWAIDPAGEIWILQARPVTSVGGADHDERPAAGRELVRGLGAAPGIASGRVRIIGSREDAADLVDGEVLVTHMTAPDWVPLMRRAAAIVTDSGGMTCHAAIVSRELGIPCVVGTVEATTTLADGAVVTVDAGRGVVTEGATATAEEPTPSSPTSLQPLRTKLLVNLSEPSQVERVRELDVEGVGLLRAELMIVESLGGEHPRALIERGESDLVVQRMAGSLRLFATAFAPRPITYRTIDFRTNEFRGLRGGERFEPVEANPMIGYRGALRYTHEPDLLELELRAIESLWAEGHTNLHLMLPFVRTPSEVEFCRTLLEGVGLLDRPGFEFWVMAEVPSVLFHLPSYAKLGIAGISIGSNDLTQLLLGVDRDSELVAEVFDERDAAVTEYIERLVHRARELGLSTSICGQAPSVHPEYAELLVGCGIDAISVNIDAVDQARRLIGAAETRLRLDEGRKEENR
jgi:pyruvate,water dikinase